MHSLKTLLAHVIFSTLPILLSHATPISWPLPKPLTDSNTTITFDGDSTWHTFHGKTSHISGKIWLENPQDFSSIRANISIPSNTLDTDRESRDERLREVMEAETYKVITFNLTRTRNLCNPDEIAYNTQCLAEIGGELTILKTTKQISVPVQITRVKDGFTILGSFEIDWSEFGVEDPSILVAKVYPTVKINFRVEI